MKVMASMFKVGDVIRTNPRDGFWGCAVVLDNHLAPDTLRDRCHIAITGTVRHAPFNLKELTDIELVVLEFERHYRPKSDVFGSRLETCITKYPNVRPGEIELIGNVSTTLVYRGPLSPTIGPGAGEFPLGSAVDLKRLGTEAVINWRRLNDQAALTAEVAAADAAYFAREDARLAKAREQARVRRQRRT